MRIFKKLFPQFIMNMDQYTFIIKKELRFINRKVNIINIYKQFYQNKKNAYIYGFGEQLGMSILLEEADRLIGCYS